MLRFMPALDVTDDVISEMLDVLERALVETKS
jgi:4-aminobutyrate aminotransferase-like enzyme